MLNNLFTNGPASPNERPTTKIRIEAEFPEGSDHRFIALLLKASLAAAAIAYVCHEVAKLW